MGILANTLDKPQNALVISFDDQGGAVSLHVDQFDLRFLGEMHVVRATDIRHESASQDWSIYLLDAQGENPRLAWKGCRGFATYEQARTVEVAWLNLCRLNDVLPTDSLGCTFLNQARKSNGLPI